MANRRQRLEAQGKAKPLAVVSFHYHKSNNQVFAYCPIRQQKVRIKGLSKREKVLIRDVFIPRQGYQSYLVGRRAAAYPFWPVASCRPLPKNISTETSRLIRTLIETLRNVHRLPIRLETVHRTGWRVRTEIWKNARTK